jgi:hypothetical protein
MEEFKLNHLVGTSSGKPPVSKGPVLGLTLPVPRFRQDLEALLQLTQSTKPLLQRVRNASCMTMAFYGFGDALSLCFGASIMRPDGLHTRYGIWPQDVENESSNYRELRNLVDTVEDEIEAGYLKDSEVWLFMDNSMAESCFHKGSSSSRALHDLVVKLKRLELEVGFSLFVVHVAGTRMIAQGTDGLLQGVLLEGVMIGNDMLHFVPLAQGAVESGTSTLVNSLRSVLGGQCSQ